MTRVVGAVGVVVVVVLGLGSAESARAQSCDSAAIAAALGQAGSGDVVRVGDCAVAGPFVVPEGAVLEGSGTASRIVAPPSGVGVTLLAGAQTTRLRDVAVSSDGRAAVVVVGSGAAAVEDVDVTASRGVGIAAQGASALVLDRVSVAGPVDHATRNTVSYDGSPLFQATFGVALVGVANASLSDLDVSGFSTMGIFSAGGNTTWIRGRSHGNVGTCFMQWGGTADLRGVHLDHVYRGDRPPELVPSALAATDGALVRVQGSTVSHNDGRGVLLDTTASVELSDVRVAHNAFTGVWVETSGYLQVDASELSDSGFANLVAVDSALVSIADTRILQARTRVSPQGVSGGDGVHLVRTAADLVAVELVGNERAGLLAELGSSLAANDLRFANVGVTGPSGALGIVAQANGTPLPLLTAGIVRRGSVRAADPAFAAGTSGFDVSHIVNPCLLPIGSKVVQGGLLYLLGGIGEQP